MCLKPFDVVFHFAAQVAVTTSIADPLGDFDVNIGGTVRLLEAVRASGTNPLLVFSSTNKVYGSLEQIPQIERATRWEFADGLKGISEAYPIDLFTPYACSKGAADYYVRDYARVYGLRTVVLRQSAIYGPRQFGAPDQGWVAWFVRAALSGQPVVVYGDGKQVRDLLHVDDLIDLYVRVVAHQERTVGRVFNVGGGPANTLSVRELVALIERHVGTRLQLSFDSIRPGDQKIYVTDVSTVTDALGWAPTIGPVDGIAGLIAWVQSAADEFP